MQLKNETLEPPFNVTDGKDVFLFPSSSRGPRDTPVFSMGKGLALQVKETYPLCDFTGTFNKLNCPRLYGVMIVREQLMSNLLVGGFQTKIKSSDETSLKVIESSLRTLSKLLNGYSTHTFHLGTSTFTHPESDTRFLELLQELCPQQNLIYYAGEIK